MPRHRGIWINPTNAARHLEDKDEKRIQICRAIDRNGFDWQVWAVAASGFFTDSYNLFATNVILPSLAFVYWPNESENRYASCINIATLAGSLLGQLTFGYLADRYGRRKLYGLELILVIVATIGVAQSSNGVVGSEPSDTSMDFLGWVIFWRLLVGVGIGAEYPLSAVITAEFAPVQQRARMMAGVFIMQPIGQLAASLVGLGTVMGIGHSYGLDISPTPLAAADQALVVDRIWRIVIGVGAFPAVVAILFRITIPESPRFTLDVEQDADRALVDAQQYLSSDEWDRPYTADEPPHDDEEMQGEQMEMTPFRNVDQDIGWPTNQAAGGARASNGSVAGSRTGSQKEIQGSHFTLREIKQFFIIEGNWRYLAGTALCWFFLDCAFYGLGINNPRTIASIWDAAQPPVITAAPPDWETDPDHPKFSIYEVLKRDAWQSTITVSIGSVVGSLVLLKAIDYVPRKNFMAWSFVALAALLAITGGSLFGVFRTNQHAVTIVFYALSQFVFNLGPNTLIFIIPAEIFPTRYRATCHGISAASGKLGSIVVQVILLSLTSTGVNNTTSGTAPANHLAIILVVFSVLMGFGALSAWRWLPEVQRGARSNWKLPSKTLEELALGWAKAEEADLATANTTSRSYVAPGRRRMQYHREAGES